MGEVVLIRTRTEPAAGALASWAGTLRERGRADFATLGIPNRRVESWKYSDLAGVLRLEQAAAKVARPLPHIRDAFVVAFSNGQLDVENSTYPKDRITALSDVLADAASPFAALIGRINAVEQAGHPIVSLNTGRLAHGFVLHVPKGESLDAPLHVRLDWHGEAARAADGHLRFLIVLDEGAHATIVETHSGAPSFATVVTELRIAETAEFTHLRMEQIDATARLSAVTLGELAAQARYRGFYLSEGAEFSRHEALLELTGEKADVSIDGAFLVSGAGHCDNTTIITHAAPSTTSHQAFRGVLAGRGKGAYQGCVKVRPEAQQTDARQMSRALLLSPEAQIATKPELEIFADDVKCGHGATAGELDANLLFFLRSRGIPEAEARAMLIEAFLSEALDTIGVESLREIAGAAVTDWLATHAGEVDHAG